MSDLFASVSADPLDSFQSGSADPLGGFDSGGMDSGSFGDMSSAANFDAPAAEIADLGVPSPVEAPVKGKKGKKEKKQKEPKAPKAPKVKVVKPKAPRPAPGESNPAWLGLCLLTGALLCGILLGSGMTGSVTLLGLMAILGVGAMLGPFLLWRAGKQYTIFEVLLALSIIALAVGSSFLLVEWARYGFTIKAAMLSFGGMTG